MTTPTTTQLSRLDSFRLFWRDFKRSIVWRILLMQRPYIFALFALILVRTAIFTITLSQVRLAIDGAIIEHTVPLSPILSRLVVLAALSFIFGVVSEQIGDAIGWRVEYELKNWIYDRLQRISPRRLDSLSTGQLISRTGADLNALEIFIRLLPTPVFAVPLILAGLITVFSINWILAPIAYASLPVTIYVIKKVKDRMWTYAYMRVNQGGVVAQAFDEPVRGIRVVKAYGREDEARARVDETARKSIVYQMTEVKYLARVDLLLDLIPAFFRTIIYVGGAFLVVRMGQMTVGTFLVFISTTRAISGFISFVDEVVSGWQWAKTSIGRVQELITWAPPERVRRDVRDLPPPSSGLELVGLDVALGGRTVLEGLDISVRPGELAVVTGARGSGKTTIAAVASGEIEPDGGAAVLDGVEVDRLDPNELRGVVRVVSEDAFLFGRTVRVNLEFGLPGQKVSDEQLARALSAAYATDVVDELEQGLDTVLGDRALDLSGGQRQRLALARALVDPPRVLILDDALSAVPPALETEILGRIREHAPQTAVLLLTRRDDATAIADHVVALPDPPVEVQAEAFLRDEAGTAGDEVEAGEGVFGQTVRRRGQTIGLREGPYDSALIPLLADTPLGDEKPPVKEKYCVDPFTRPGLISTLTPMKGRVFVAALFLLLFTLIGLVPERITGLLTDALNEEDLGGSILFGLAVLGVASGLGFARIAFRIFQTRVGAGVVYLLRRRLFQRLTTLGIDFYDREAPGQILTRVVVDLYNVSQFLSDRFRSVFTLLTTGALILFSLAAAFILAPSVALYIVVFFIPLMLVLTVIQLPFIDRAYTKRRERNGDLLTRLHEDFAGRYVIKGFGAEEEARRQYHDMNMKVRHADREVATIRNAYQELVQIAGRLATVAIYARAGDQVLVGAITIGVLVTVEAYLDDVLDRIPSLGRLWQRYLNVRVSFRKLRELYDAEVLPPENPNAVPVPVPLDGGFSFEGVTFAYPHTGRTVLAGLTLDIAPGDVVAIVGQTGAGKSSVAKLMSRIYDPDEGRILVDGLDLRELNLSEYRQRVGVVPQDEFMFRGSVWDNIAYVKPDASQEDVETAAIAVGAYDALVAVPGGVVEEQGRNLTHAQRQLISLSRAWLVSPDVFVLDEATSGLDADAETKVLDAFLGLGRTTVVVTHRQAVAKRADLVIVLDKGRIVEAGTNDELADANGAYSRLWVTEKVPVASRARNGNGGSRRRATKPAASGAAASGAAKKPATRKTATSATKRNGTKGNGAKGEGPPGNGRNGRGTRGSES